MRRGRLDLGLWAAYAVALLATFASLFPLYWLFVISTKTPREAFETPPQLLYIPDFSKYAEIWSTAGFSSAFFNSVLLVLLGVTLTLAVATPAAYAITRFRVRDRYLRLWLLLAYTTPEFLFVIPMYVAYQQLGLYDTVIGLAIVYQVFAIPFAVWLLQSFLLEVPRSSATPRGSTVPGAADAAAGLSAPRGARNRGDCDPRRNQHVERGDHRPLADLRRGADGADRCRGVPRLRSDPLAGDGRSGGDGRRSNDRLRRHRPALPRQGTHVWSCEMNETIDLSGRRALVTGAGRGIGRAIALRLAAAERTSRSTTSTRPPPNEPPPT